MHLPIVLADSGALLTRSSRGRGIAAVLAGLCHASIVLGLAVLCGCSGGTPSERTTPAVKTANTEIGDTESLARVVIPDERLQDIGFLNLWAGRPSKGGITNAWFLLDSLYVERQEGPSKFFLEKIEGATGLQSWSFPLEGRLEFAPQVYRYPKHLRAEKNDELFLVQHKDGSGDHVFCLDDRFGATTYTIPCGFLVSSPASASEEFVFVGSWNKTVYAFSKQTQRQSWFYITEGPIVAAPETGDVNVFVGSEDGFLYCLNQEKGWLQGTSWRVRTGAKIEGKPTFYRSRIYLGSWDYKVYRFEMYQGIRNWNHSVGARVSQPIFPFKDWIFAVREGDVAAGKKERALVAIEDGVESRINWERPAVRRVLAADGLHCYVLADDGAMNINALRLGDGTPAWTLDAGSFDFVLGQDAEQGAAREKWGQIYLVSRDGIMQCIRPRR
ncbi:MAG: PQQ-binding-like beta-propeller repeat protein [Planctomycetes bacterium]|nr:PQQ-binding-like beta-propeller repeat protein [Planctomycetota bacterium]